MHRKNKDSALSGGFFERSVPCLWKLAIRMSLYRSSDVIRMNMRNIRYPAITGTTDFFLYRCSGSVSGSGREWCCIHMPAHCSISNCVQTVQCGFGWWAG